MRIIVAAVLGWVGVACGSKMPSECEQTLSTMRKLAVIAKASDAELEAEEAKLELQVETDPERARAVCIELNARAAEIAFKGTPMAVAAKAKRHPLVDLVERYADDICKCTDQSCVSQVTDKFSQESTEVSKKSGAGSEDDGKAIVAAGQRASDCVTKIAKGER